MPNMQCQNCGALWPIESTPTMLRFSSEIFSSWTSPAEIGSVDGNMLHCPKCPDERLDSAMYQGDDRNTSGDEDETPLEDR